MKNVKVFLASSSELRNERLLFIEFINRMNHDWAHRNVTLLADTWEAQSTAVSETRSQDEYNKRIRESQIVVIIAYTKVGMYTSEEFEVAYQQFKKHGSPKIYIYYKKVEEGVGIDESKSIFEKRIAEIQHFPTHYIHDTEFHNLFEQELNKLTISGYIKLDRKNKSLSLSLPLINQDMVIGKENEIDRLRNLLISDSSESVTINGIAGLGKTTLARLYMTRYFAEYEHILWINQLTPDLETSFINTTGLIKNLGIDENSFKREEIFLEILRQLNQISAKPNLIIIDNADESVNRYIHQLPSRPNWHLLVTSREQIESTARSIQVDFLTAHNALLLFNRHYKLGKISEDDINGLNKHVGYHTLTMELLAKTAQVQRYPIEKLKEALKTDLRSGAAIEHNKLEKISSVGAYVRGIFKIANLSPDELWMAKQFACLPNAFHQYEKLKNLLVSEKDLHASDFAETLNALSNAGWLLYDEHLDAYKMHIVITETIKSGIEILPEDVQYLTEQINSTLESLKSSEIPDQNFEIELFAETILGVFGKKSNDRLFFMRSMLSRCQLRFGLFEKSLNTSLDIVKYAHHNFGPDDRRTAILYASYGSRLEQVGQSKKAIAYFAEALNGIEKKFESTDPEMGLIYGKAATTLESLGFYQEALAAYEKNYEIDFVNFGPDYEQHSISFNNIGLLLQKTGNLTAAREMFLRGLNLLQNNQRMMRSSANLYASLSLVSHNLGEYLESRTAALTALGILEGHFKHEVRLIASCYGHLTAACLGLGEMNEAEQYARVALTKYQEGFGLKHQLTLVRNITLIEILRFNNQIAEALLVVNEIWGLFDETLLQGNIDPHLRRLADLRQILIDSQ